MKNIFKLFAIVALGLFATSCANDLTNDLQVSGGEVEVSFTTGVPSRAISDGSQATKLYVQAYAVQNNGTTVNLKKAASAVADVVDLKATVNLKFVQGMTYKVVFWAQHPSLADPTFADNQAEVEIDYSAANDENRDAFYAVIESLTINGPATHDVKLYRPFAQLNVATTDLAEAQTLGFELKDVTVKAYAYNKLNLLTGEPIGNLEEVTFPAAVLSGEKLNGNDWLSFNYLLVDDEQHTLPEVVVTIAQNYGSPRIITEYAVPVKRNYRTNLVGALLTTTNGFNVELVPAIEDIPGYPTAKDQLISVATNGGTLTLTEDVVLEEYLEIKGNVILDLNGKNITASDSDGYVLYNESGATLTINDSTNNSVVTGVIYTGPGSETIVNGGTFNAKTGANFILLNGGGKLTLNGGTVNASAYYPVYSYNDNHELVINDVTVNATFGCLNTYGANGKVTINGGTFNMTGVEGNTSHIAYFSTDTNVTINGGSFNKVGNISMSGTGGGGICVTNGANATIKGGNFAGDYADIYNWGGSDTTISIESGTFKFEPNASFIAAGYAAAQNTDGTWSVGKALTDTNVAEVFSNLSTTEPTTIIVTEDLNTTEPLVVPAGAEANIILADAKQIVSETADAFVVNEGATLTISGNGTVKSNGAPIRAIGGKVIVEGGTFTQTGAWNTATSTYRYSIDSREGGEVIVKGGTFNTNNGLISVAAGSSLVIDGGEFTFENNTGGTRHFAYVSGDLTINDGVFRGVADSGAGGCLFCGAASTCNIQINGGKFTSLWTSGSVNRIFESYASGSSINVTGGLFNTDGGIASFVEANTDPATSAEYPYVAK